MEYVTFAEMLQKRRDDGSIVFQFMHQSAGGSRHSTRARKFPRISNLGVFVFSENQDP
jgi:hypothetical protein